MAKSDKSKTCKLSAIYTSFQGYRSSRWLLKAAPVILVFPRRVSEKKLGDKDCMWDILVYPTEINTSNWHELEINLNGSMESQKDVTFTLEIWQAFQWKYVYNHTFSRLTLFRKKLHFKNQYTYHHHDYSMQSY